MAADGTQLLRAGAFAFTFTIDGAITTVVAADPVEEELARRRDRGASKKTDSDAYKKTDGDVAKKRGRDGGLDRCEESDEVRGWSSAVVERGLALRRRGGSASCSRPRRGLIVGEEAAESGALGVDAEAEAEAAVEVEEPLVDPTLEFFYLAVL